MYLDECACGAELMEWLSRAPKMWSGQAQALADLFCAGMGAWSGNEGWSVSELLRCGPCWQAAREKAGEEGSGELRAYVEGLRRAGGGDEGLAGLAHRSLFMGAEHAVWILEEHCRRREQLELPRLWALPWLGSCADWKSGLEAALAAGLERDELGACPQSGCAGAQAKVWI